MFLLVTFNEQNEPSIFRESWFMSSLISEAESRAQLWNESWIIYDKNDNEVLHSRPAHEDAELRYAY